MRVKLKLKVLYRNWYYITLEINDFETHTYFKSSY
jgi:hypothetical protein